MGRRPERLGEQRVAHAPVLLPAGHRHGERAVQAAADEVRAELEEALAERTKAVEDTRAELEDVRLQADCLASVSR